MSEAKTKYLAIGPNVFGFGNSSKEAIKVARSCGNCKGLRATKFGVYTVADDAYVTDYGSVSGIIELVPGYTEWRR